ncbi:serine/arginine repetitive matrix protein 1 [Nematostella vectensis]|uniref:serine/arginine repetitive matrix protein 1 n=1 Tax=Nematostella vectensis TaxID=45351 RepID=UPI0013900E70|nr:serine/arginine repetitive matrix protein 1 [Nematostella vectensis]
MNGYHTASPKRRGNQIKIVLRSIARPRKPNSSNARESQVMVDKKTSSPIIAFASGPGFESREKEINLRDLNGVNVNELDDSLRDILIERQRNSRASSVTTTDDNDDSASIVSELSTCSSAVTIGLEPVDEIESKYPPSPATQHKSFMSKARRKSPRPPPSSPRYHEHIPNYPLSSPRCHEHIPNYPSSSEAEDEEKKNSLGRKTTKKITNLFSFSSSSSSNQNLSTIDNYSCEKAPTPERKRRQSFSRRSPLNFGGFFGGGTMSNAGSNQSISESKPDLTAESPGSPVITREPKGPPPTPPPKPSRKHSLGTRKPISLQESKQRRNTDPSLPPGTILEAQQSNRMELKVDEDPNQDRVRKVSFSTLAPVIQEVDSPGTPEPATVEPKEVFFKDDDIKLRDLMEDILRAHMLSMKDYKKPTCDRTGKSICKVIKTLVEAMKAAEGMECKVVCLVYIAAIRDSGVYMSTQALWDNDQDNFAAASFRNDSVFGFATVMATPLMTV